MTEPATATPDPPTPAGPLAAGEVAAGARLLAGDLLLPAAVLRESALAHNADWMRRFLARTGASIAPHGKTTMCPALFERQLADGAWAITVATVPQLQVCRRFGIRRVILANQLVGRAAIAAVLDLLAEDPGFELWCLVDSLESVAELEAAAAAFGEGTGLARPLRLLLETGVAGGRTGCRDRETALAVARAVAAAPHLALAGVEGFEGLIQGDSEAAREAAVAGFLEVLAGLAEACDAEGLFGRDDEIGGEVLLTAGGSAFYDLVAARLSAVRLSRPARVVTRSGCYLTHDSGLYGRAFERLLERAPALAALGEGPRPALEVWSLVQSRPEPGKAVLTFGKRDAGFDAGLPVPLWWHRPGAGDQAGGPHALEGHVVTKLHDQHAEVALPEGSPLKVGDLVGCGVSHPCTTFDRWRVVYTVDDGYRVTGALETYF